MGGGAGKGVRCRHLGKGEEGEKKRREGPAVDPSHLSWRPTSPHAISIKSGSQVDKFKEMHLTKEKANFIKCPIIKESPVSLECKVVEVKELGSHTMFLAEVLSIDADEEYINEKGEFDISKCNLIAYANGGYYALGRKIGKFRLFC